MKRFLVILAFAALACSCEIPFSIKDISEPRFMIQCMPVPGDDAFLLNIAYANPAYGEKRVGLYPFKSADVKVEVNGKTLDCSKLEWEQDGDNHFTFIKAGLKPGDNVSVTVKGEKMPTASGSTTVPDYPAISSITLDRLEPNDTTEARRITVKMAQAPRDDEYYGLNITVYQEFYSVKMDMVPPFIKIDTTGYQYSRTASPTLSMTDMNNLDLDAFAQVQYVYGYLANDNLATDRYSPVTLLTGKQFDGDSYSFTINGNADIFGFLDYLPTDPDEGEPEEPVEQEGGEQLTDVDPEDPEEPEDPDVPEFSYPIGSKTWYFVNLYHLSDESYNYCKAQYLMEFNMLSNFGVTPPNFTYSNVRDGLGIVGGVAYKPWEKFPDPDNKEPEIPSMEELMKALADYYNSLITNEETGPIEN